ncbi:hypothetical protein [Enterobacter sp.]|uniref:DUF7716 domain-containing protein n=1 Tax=Enterobacter sp. TaxID=42895 RepID=UPI00296E45C5|nr:hypothetical protein [Enterobacter sp.]
MLTRDAQYRLTEIITYMKETNCQDDNFCLYGNDTDDDLISDGKYFISDYPKVENDKEIYPFPVQQRNLSYIYSGEQFADVISSVSEQKELATIDEYIKALNYYLEHDDFLDL